MHRNQKKKKKIWHQHNKAEIIRNITWRHLLSARWIYRTKPLPATNGHLPNFARAEFTYEKSLTSPFRKLNFSSSTTSVGKPKQAKGQPQEHLRRLLASQGQGQAQEAVDLGVFPHRSPPLSSPVHSHSLSMPEIMESVSGVLWSKRDRQLSGLSNPSSSSHSPPFLAPLTYETPAPPSGYKDLEIQDGVISSPWGAGYPSALL